MSSSKSAVLREFFNQSVETKKRTAASEMLQEQVLKASDAIRSSYLGGGCLFAAGNGGSAADAQHLVAELVARFHKERNSIRAFAMTVDSSILTAIGNDYSYDEVFARQVSGLMSSKDIFLAITTSGSSKNILRALEICREKGIPSILLTGQTGGKARELATHLITVPSTDTRLIQESHLMIYHTLCQLIEHDLVEAGLCQYQ